jgi:hypothetical protein
MEETVKKRVAISVSLFAIAMALVILNTSQPAAQEASASTNEKSVDYEFFKTRVEPVFLKMRPGHARCYACHRPGGEGYHSFFHLEKLSPESTSWTEEQSRRNFQVVSMLVTPGEPLTSRLLMHPLWHPGVAGDYHEGGRQFASQNDPDWVTLAEWVGGQKAGGPSDK